MAVYRRIRDYSPCFGRALPLWVGYERMNRHYREELVGITVMTAPDGARAAAEFTVLGEYLATDEGLPPAKGQSYRLNAGAFFAVRDGKVARVTNYYNLEDWIRQVSG